MSIAYTKRQAVFDDVVGADEAERLLEWLQGSPSATADLSGCAHLHPANLQVLMAAGTKIAAWPKDAEFSGLLMTALEAGRKDGGS
jgi:hypothetical protein